MTEASSDTRSRIVIVALGGLLLLGGAVAYVVAGARPDPNLADRSEAATARVDTFERPATPAETDPPTSELPFADAEVESIAPSTAVLHPGDVVFINRVPGDDYGRLGVSRTDGSRLLLDLSCERAHVASGVGLCTSGPNMVGGYTSTVIDFTQEALPPIQVMVSDLPSRARVSDNGQWVSGTMFSSGTSYQDIAAFSTRVSITGLLGLGSHTFLEDFDVAHSDRRYESPLAKYWGVSFGDDASFWVTGAFDGGPELLQGDANAKELTPTGIEGSCPSLSPDRRTLVYKRAEANGVFRLVARDLETGETWDLGETRDVDDQVEWFDDNSILYALHVGEPTAEQPEYDIWKLDIAPGSTPELFIPNADSPAAQ